MYFLAGRESLMDECENSIDVSSIISLNNMKKPNVLVLLNYIALNGYEFISSCTSDKEGLNIRLSTNQVALLHKCCNQMPNWIVYHLMYMKLCSRK